jgi:hypothetical protein
MSFLPTRRLYRNEQHITLYDFVDVLPRKLNIRPDYAEPAGRKFTDMRTMFRQASVVPFDEVYGEHLEVFNARPASTSEIEVMDGLKTRLLEVVEENWSPDLHHAVLHSSGYDSRVLSWVVRELANRNGRGWLSPGLTFLCTRWEGAEFEAVMRQEGWGHENYLVVGNGVAAEDRYYEDQLRFGSAWRRLGGTMAIPTNLFWSPVRRALGGGGSPPRVQLWSGYAANETIGYDELHGSLGTAWRRMYYGLMFQRPYKADDYVFPFSDAGIARLGHSFVHLGMDRLDLLKRLDEGLAGLARVDGSGDLGHPIADDLVLLAMDDLKGSWYGRNVLGGSVRGPGRCSTDPDRFWSRWSAASLCEHLLSQGYEVKVR